MDEQADASHSNDTASSLSSYYSYHHDHPSNLTVVTTVRIRVTPLQDHPVSWGILFFGFVIATVVATLQVIRENRILKNPSTRSNDDALERGDTEVPLYSSADVTRSLFRRVIWIALISRVCFMPLQIWMYPMWWQFVGDSMPEMVFATAWSLLVTFFVQLVGIASGSGGTDTSPGLVMQAVAWVVYCILIIVEWFNPVVAVLLFTLLGGVYATLLGIVLYFLPRLVYLMKPDQRKKLGLRLGICTLTCCCVFGGHMVGYGRLVVAPPLKVYWWIKYGALELLPAVVFLSIMKPSVDRSNSQRNAPDDALEAHRETFNRPSSFGRLESATQRSNSRRAIDGRGSYGAIEHTGSTND